ncbi:MAG: Omp28-related outer membrane protein, partial [Bacteroidales bacterium]|nr:Omp28-related outer membrane protein [Bacteroidales bacterium]
MKKICYKLVVLTIWVLGLSGLAFSYGQVSESPRPKAVLLEEQTGAGCGNCPDGAAMIATLKARMGAAFQAIAYHVGHYAEPGGSSPDFRTDYGDSLLEYWGEYGYPQGEIDRMCFPFSPGLMAIGRGNWNRAVESRLSDTATVNLWAAASLDAAARELTVEVEGYYVRSSDSSSNRLHVALIQNHIEGPQNQAPVGYLHEHVFRDFLTPLWGDTLAETTAGTKFSKTYTYTVPTSYRGVKAELRNLEVVVFVSADRGDVLNVTGCKPALSGIADPMSATLTLETLPKRYGACDFAAVLTCGYNDTIKRIAYEATLNGETKAYEQTVDVPPYEQASVTLRIDAYMPAVQNEITFRLVSLNGTPYTGAAVKATFNEPLPVVSPLTVELFTDAHPEEVYWYVADQQGEIIYEFGPYKGEGQVSVTEGLKLETGCYNLVFCDTKWDGWQERPRGSYKIKDMDGKMVAQNADVRDKGDLVAVRVTGKGGEPTAVETLEDKAGLSVSSAYGRLYVHNPLSVRIDGIRIYSAMGACLEAYAFHTDESVTLSTA